MFLYSGALEDAYAKEFVDTVIDAKERNNVCLFLCTFGGDPDAAYKVAKCMQRYYDNFTLYICGYCKSAGTLVALGAKEIVMSPHGELGPLDVQLVKRDEIAFHSSGLDLLQVMDYLLRRSSDIFDKHFMSLINKSRGAITVKTSADIASKLTNGLISPIVSQIDPSRLGEVKRAIRIALDYGERLNGNRERVASLINDYPSHSFVIDYDEAKAIFGNVRELDEDEANLNIALSVVLENEFGQDCLNHPSREVIVLNLSALLNQDEEEENEKEVKKDVGKKTKRKKYAISRY